MAFQERKILVTGGTGSFGKEFIKYLLEHDCPKKIVVFSRDEMKQHFMKGEYKELDKNHILEFVIGDVRDKERLDKACKDIDYIVHTAAMKIVLAAEENPAETIKTNILGAMNLIDVAVKNNVQKVIALSTDKACNPLSLYGATKLCSERLFISANAHSYPRGTLFSIVRYGNVIGSRGSIIPIFLEKRKTGVIPITDERMTRFFMTLQQSVQLVLRCFDNMKGGEIFVPKIPTMKIVDLAKAIAPECRIEYIGIKPGEKLHEAMIVSDDARNTIEFDDYYIIKPDFDWWDNKNHFNGKPVPENFSYASNTNPNFLKTDEIRELIKEFI